ncbi:hypothetical protein DV963_08345 [Staphylococcus pseudintermedius]|nr:hypothetical protein DV963_08345 [Staphylococcus pseudintermedius]
MIWHEVIDVNDDFVVLDVLRHKYCLRATNPYNNAGNAIVPPVISIIINITKPVIKLLINCFSFICLYIAFSSNLLIKHCKKMIRSVGRTQIVSLAYHDVLE